MGRDTEKKDFFSLLSFPGTQRKRKGTILYKRNILSEHKRKNIFILWYFKKIKIEYLENLFDHRI